MRCLLKGALWGIVLLSIGGLAFAKFATPEDAIRYRQAVMTIIGEHFGRVAAVVTGEAANNEKMLARQTLLLRTMAALPWEACLVPGSYSGKTTLKKAVLKERDQFMNKAQDLEQSIDKLDETVKSGDLNAIRAQFGNVARNCKDCHNTFRNL